MYTVEHAETEREKLRTARRLQETAARLLAALKGAANWIEAYADKTDDPAYAHKYAQNLYALIAEAEGRS